MNTKPATEFIHEGDYVVAVQIELIEPDTGWSPVMSVDDARKLEHAAEALRVGDLERARTYGVLYKMAPVALEERVPVAV